MDHIVGFGFRPTDEELINPDLKNKIKGQTWLVDNPINEVNIYSFDPWDLRLQSKFGSDDYVWYFFCRVENNKQQSRQTPSGYWKKTGRTLKIKPRRGNHDKIGEKKVYRFYKGRTYQRNWACTSTIRPFPLFIRRPTSYAKWHLRVKTRIFHLLMEWNLISEPPVHGNSGSFLGGLQSANQFNTQQQDPYLDEDETERLLGSLTTEDLEFMLGDEEIASYSVMQENCNHYRPHESLSGLYTGDFSDSDAESTSEASPNETWSPVDSAGSSNGECLNHKNDVLASGINGEAEGKATQLQLQHVTLVREEVREAMDPSEKEIKMEKEKQMKDQEDTRKKCWFVFEVDTSRKNQVINIILLFISFTSSYPLTILSSPCFAIDLIPPHSYS